MLAMLAVLSALALLVLVPSGTAVSIPRTSKREDGVPARKTAQQVCACGAADAPFVVRIVFAGVMCSS